MRAHPRPPTGVRPQLTRAAVRVHVLDLPARASAKMITTEAVKNAIRELDGAHRRVEAGTVGSESLP